MATQPYYVVGEADFIRVKKLNADHELIGDVVAVIDLDGGDVGGAGGAVMDLDGGDADG